MNRDLGRQSNIQSASDRAPSGPENTTSISERSAGASISSHEGDRPCSNTEGLGRKGRSRSAERGISRERPGSAGERLQGSDREQDRSTGLDRDRERERDRDRDRDRDRGSGSERSERERDRGVVSSRESERVSSSQKPAVTVDKDAEGEKLARTERKNSTGGSVGGRSVSLDKLTIGEKSARRQSDHPDKPSSSSKEKEGSERAAKSDRSVTWLCQTSHIHNQKKAQYSAFICKHSCYV